MTIETCPVCHGAKYVNDSLHAVWIQARDRLKEPPVEKCPYCFGNGEINKG